MASAPSPRFEQALKLIDEAHAQDPTSSQGTDMPYELHYAEKMSNYLHQRFPEADELLCLAIRAQHLKRWEVPRSSYPMNRPGYHSWRSTLKKRQAGMAADMCREAGYSEEESERVASLIRKENMKSEHDSQVLEDVACLVFLDDQFEQFEKEHDQDKIVRILKKTWVKMSPEGHRLALEINMSDRARSLVERALAD